MIYGVRFKDGVLPIQRLDRAGVRILGALDTTARRLGLDLMVTCADGEHQPTDPHALGEAFDVRTHDFDPELKLRILRALLLELQDVSDPQDAPMAVNDGLATKHFFGWIEHPLQPAEHLHIQRRKGTVYA